VVRGAGDIPLILPSLILPCTLLGDSVSFKELAVSGVPINGDRPGAGDRPREGVAAGECALESDPFHAFGVAGRPLMLIPRMDIARDGRSGAEGLLSTEALRSNCLAQLFNVHSDLDRRKSDSSSSLVVFISLATDSSRLRPRGRDSSLSLEWGGSLSVSSSS